MHTLRKAVVIGTRALIIPVKLALTNCKPIASNILSIKSLIAGNIN